MTFFENFRRKKINPEKIKRKAELMGELIKKKEAKKEKEIDNILKNLGIWKKISNEDHPLSLKLKEIYEKRERNGFEKEKIFKKIEIYIRKLLSEKGIESAEEIELLVEKEIMTEEIYGKLKLHAPDNEYKIKEF